MLGLKRFINTPCFKRQGYLYKLIQRSGNVSFYKALSSKKETLEGYVVAKIRIKDGETAPNGDYIRPREKFPSPSEFGKYGWFYLPESFHSAKEHFLNLCCSKKNKINLKSATHKKTKVRRKHFFLHE